MIATHLKYTLLMALSVSLYTRTMNPLAVGSPTMESLTQVQLATTVALVTATP